MKLKVLLFFSMVFFQGYLFAATPAADLSQLLSGIQTMQADFTQVMTDKNAKQIQKSVGRMALERPGKFRWDVKKPVAQLVVTNGSKLWIYDPDLDQVTIKVLSKEVGESPAMLLSNPTVSIEKDYKVEAINDKSSKMQWYALVPKSQNSMFAKIKFGFADKKIQEMELQDHLGQTTAIAFYNIKHNASLASSLFSFKPPANVDVIDETVKK